MKKVIIAFILLASAYSVSAQFSSIDTLRKFNNKYIRNSAVDAFTNLRLNTVINGIINFTDSAYNASAAGKLDSIVIVHDTVLVSYRGGSIVGRDTFRIVGTGIGTDSAQNAGFGLTKQVAGTTRTLKVDTAVLFPAVRATVPSGSGSPNSNVGSAYRLAIAGTNNLKTIDPVTSAGILIDTATANVLKIRVDSSAFSTVAKLRDSSANKVSNVGLIGPILTQTKNGVTTTIGTITATVALLPPQANAELDTIRINCDTIIHKFNLNANRAIKFVNRHNGSPVHLVITHTVDSTYITNFPGKTPTGFWWALGTDEVTDIEGVCIDSAANEWRWKFAVYDALITPVNATHLQVAFSPWMYPSRKVYYDSLSIREKINLVWLYGDQYNHSDIDYIREFGWMTDTAAVAGMPVMPGIDNSNAAEIAAMIKDLKDKPAVYKIVGKPTFIMYYFTQSVYNSVVASLATDGIVYGRDYLIMAHMLYPQPDGLGGYTQYGGNLSSVGAANNMYDVNGPIYGVVNFFVDKGTSNSATALQNGITEDSILNVVGKARGKWTFAGLNMDYTSAQYTDYDWKDYAAKWYKIIRTPVQDRVNGVMRATTADYKERSYLSKIFNLAYEQPGYSFVPRLALHTTFGPNISCFPALSHDGVTAFERPFVDAFLNRKDSIVIDHDAIFLKCPLHFRAATPITTVPAELSVVPSIDAAWIAASPFGLTPSWVGAGLIPNFDKIRVACFLTAPAQIRINSTLSGTTFPAGIAYFEIPLALGTPTVDIVRSGTTVASGTAPQPVTTSTYPGGYSFMEVQIF